MSNRETMLRQSHIIAKLRQKPHTFEEINSALELEGEISGYKLTCSIRTFQRDIEQILSLYEIEIKFNRSEGVYQIVEESNKNHHERLLEVFDMFNALQISSSYSNHIILEKRKPSGTHNMHGLLHAVKNKVEISFEHEKFWEAETEKRIRRVQPLALIEARYRWYLIAKDTEDEGIKTFGLDRISNINFFKKTFTPPKGYNPEKAFQHSFGIINPENAKPEKVLLSLSPEQGKYIHSLPLHHSQKLIEKSEKEYRFELFLIPTYDFEMELMSLGSNVTVLKPNSLQKSIAAKFKAALEKYR